MMPQLSTIFPFIIRLTPIPVTVDDLPVGGMPASSPVCVPCAVQRVTTLSPSAICLWGNRELNVREGVAVYRMVILLVLWISPVVDTGPNKARVPPPHRVERPEPIPSDGRRTALRSRSGLADGPIPFQEVAAMSRKQRTHLRGKRGQAFADRIRGIALDHILCVSLDISKYFHVVMIHNGLGEIVTPPLRSTSFRVGLTDCARPSTTR